MTSTQRLLDAQNSVLSRRVLDKLASEACANISHSIISRIKTPEILRAGNDSLPKFSHNEMKERGWELYSMNIDTGKCDDDRPVFMEPLVRTEMEIL
jgi:hypothetical protein